MGEAIRNIDLAAAIRNTGIMKWSIAERSNMSAARLSHILNGHRAPRPEEKRALAKALGVGVREIFPRNGKGK